MSQQTPKKRVLFVRRSMPVLLVVFGVLSILGTNFRSPQIAHATTNSTINFQARLKTASGAIVPDGNYFIEFNLYTASGTGTTIWTERYQGSAYTCAFGSSTGNTNNKVTVVNGYLSVALGTLCTFPSTINWDQPLWLTMNVGGSGGTASYDGEMSPRLQITSVPYAFRAGQLGTSNAGSTLTSTLSINAPTGGNQTFQIQDQGAAGTYNLLTAPNGSDGYVKLQGSTPGTQQTGNLNIGGTVLAGTAVTTPTLQSGSGVALTVTGNAASTWSTSAGLLTISGGGGVTVNSAAGTTSSAITIQTGNASSGTAGSVTIDNGTSSTGSGAINIGTSTSNHTISIGNAASGVQAITIGAATNTTSSTTINGGNGSSAISLVTGNNGTAAGGINIGNTTGAFTQSINLGTNATASSNTTVTVGSLIGSSTTNVQAGTGNLNLITNSSSAGTIVKTNTNSATAFQVQNASGTPIFLVDTSTTSNLITNPGFEVNVTSGWSGTNATLTRNTTKGQYFHGQASMNVNVTTAGGGAQATGFTSSITPAQYTFSFYAMNSTAGTLGVTITGGSAPACTLNSTSMSTSGFQRYYCTFTSTSTNVTGITITSSTTGLFYVDGVELNTGATPAPYGAQGAIQLRGIVNSPATFQSTSNSTTAFQIQDSAGTGNTFVVDTINNRIGIGKVTPGYTLDVNGQINSASGFVANGTAGSNTTCTSGNVLTNQVVSGGIITGGTCAANGAGASTTLQNAYDNSSSPAVINESTSKGINIRDNASTVGTIFAIQNSTGGTSYLSTTATGTTITGTLTVGSQQVFNSSGILQSAALSGSYTTAVQINNASSTFTGSTVTTSTLQSGASTALTITGNAASTWSTSAGLLSISGAAGVTVNSAAGTTSSAITIQTGNASSGTAGSVTIDNGTSSTGSGVINIGTSTSNHTINIGNASSGVQAINIGSANSTNTVSVLGGNGSNAITVATGNNGTAAGGITIGNTTGAFTQTINLGTNATASSSTTVNIGSTVAGATVLQSAGGVTVNASTTLGASAGTGTFTNNGSTYNATLAISNSTGTFGTGAAATTVDVYTSFSINAGTTGLTYTPPNPSSTGNYGRVIYISNIGSNTFTLLGSPLKAGASATLVWSNTSGGATWQYSGADGNSILNQSTSTQTADFKISGTGTAATLQGTTTVQSPLFDTASGVGLSVGTGNATSITLGKTTTTVTINGSTTLGASAGTGTFTNNGSTVNSTLVISNSTGVFGTGVNTTTVDVYTSFSINAGTTGLTYAPPTPSAATTYGRIIYVSNVGSNTFTLLGSPLKAGASATLIWSNTSGGASWQYSGADGNSILNQSTSTQTADFKISGTGTIGTSLTVPLIQSSGGMLIQAGAGAVTLSLDSTDSSGTVSIANANAGNVSIAANNVAHTINIGTGGGGTTNQVVTVGSLTGSGSYTSIQGTAGVFVTTNSSSQGLLLKTNTNTGSAFLVQNSTSGVLFNINSSTGTITLGDGSTNYVNFTTSGGLTAFGTAQHAKKIVLTPEYAGAVLDGASDTGCTATNGTMTSGFQNSITGFGNTTQSYYKWTTTAGTAQCYDVVAQVAVPSDWSSWVSGGALTINGYTSNTSTGKIEVQVLDTAGTAETNYNYANLTPGSTTTWSTLSATTNTLSGTYTANGYMTIRIRMSSPTSGDVRIGNITLSYNSKW